MNRSQCLRLKELSYLSWVVVRQKNSSKLFRGGMSLILQNVLGTVWYRKRAPSPLPNVPPSLLFPHGRTPSELSKFQGHALAKACAVRRNTHCHTMHRDIFTHTYNRDVCFSKRSNFSVSNHFNFTSTSTCSLRIMQLYSYPLPTQITSACGFVWLRWGGRSGQGRGENKKLNER